MFFYQILREWPPGYGGIERVAHELASSLDGLIYSLDSSRIRHNNDDAFSVNYIRRYLPSLNIFDRLYLPLPSRALFSLLISREALIGHLPSPAVFLSLVLARLLRPNRTVIVYWHCFLDPDPGFIGFCHRIYQYFSLLILPLFTAVVTTSPDLAYEVERIGCSKKRIFVIPCCLNSSQEKLLLKLPLSHFDRYSPLRVCFIGRLDSYKRLDWLLQSLFTLKSPWHLSIVGDGPKRAYFEKLASDLAINNPDLSSNSISFLGRQTESQKLQKLNSSHLLVLPSDRCNEAFGIVQLEAMAAGRLSLAFNCPRSGMGWVCDLPGLTWSKHRDELGSVLQMLADDRLLLHQLSLQSRHRYLTLFSRRVWHERLSSLVNQT